MFLTVHGPFGDAESLAVHNQQRKTLAELVGSNAGHVEACRFNGAFQSDWHRLRPGTGDRVDVYVRPGEFFTLAGAIQAIIAAVVSMALGQIVRALTPKPKKPKLDGSSKEQAFGIAGLTNMTGEGTPKFVVYGQNEVAGALISSKIRVAPGGKGMIADVLYFMGDTGGDTYFSIGPPKINDIAIENYPDTSYVVRLGADDQAVIPEFENIDNVFSDTRTISPTPIVYSTHGNQVQRLKPILLFNTFYLADSKGRDQNAHASVKVEAKKTSEGSGSFFEIGGSPFEIEGLSKSQFFYSFQTDLASKDSWDLRFTLLSTDSIGGEPILYNVQETEFTSRNYGGSALMGILGIQSAQIQSLESLKVTTIVEGKVVFDPTIPSPVYSRKRVWITRDFLTHARLGLGQRIDATEFDDAGSLASQQYYDETVDGQNGAEVRDLCDVIYTGQNGKWDFLRDTLCGEARGRLIPGEKFRFVVKRPWAGGDPVGNLLWSEPGNMIEGSLETEYGLPEEEYNQWLGEFLDEEEDYNRRVVPWPQTADLGDAFPAADGRHYDSIKRESEVLRELMISAKESALVKRRWRFGATYEALPSQPMDIDKISLKRIGIDGAYSGFCQQESTLTELCLDRMVELESGVTYRVEIRHPNNAVESRIIANPAGSYGLIFPTVPFAAAPIEGIWALGKQDLDIVPAFIEETEMDDGGRHRVLVSEYIPAVWTPDPLPAKSVTRRFGFQLLPPLPLRDASAVEELTLNIDGIWQSIMQFDVTPEIPLHGGLAQAGGLNTIQLSTLDSNRDNFFNGALVRIVLGTGAGQQRRIIGYTGSTRVAQGDFNWVTVPNSTSRYEVEFDRFGAYWGFKVERGPSAGGPFTEFSRFPGTHGQYSQRGQASPEYIRFTPVSQDGQENPLARLIIFVPSSGALAQLQQTLQDGGINLVSRTSFVGFTSVNVTPFLPAGVTIRSVILQARLDVLVDADGPINVSFKSRFRKAGSSAVLNLPNIEAVVRVGGTGAFGGFQNQTIIVDCHENTFQYDLAVTLASGFEVATVHELRIDLVGFNL